MLKIPLIASGILASVIIVQIISLATLRWGIENWTATSANSQDFKMTTYLGLASVHSVSSGDLDVINYDKMYPYDDPDCKKVDYCKERDGPSARGALAFTIISLLISVAGSVFTFLFARGAVGLGLVSIILGLLAFVTQLLACIIHAAGKARVTDIQSYVKSADLGFSPTKITTETEVGTSWVIALVASFACLLQAIVMYRERRKALYQAL
jgi:hypothetical protein